MTNARSSTTAANTEQIEDTVYAIWCRELKNPTAQRTDEFYSTGGDSLRAIRLLAALEQHFDIELSVQHFAGQVTIKSLASEVAASLSCAQQTLGNAREYGEI